MDTVYAVIDAELRRRRLQWADLARALGTTDQRVNNWKRRKVPPGLYGEIAAFFGDWSIEQVMGIAPATRPAKPPAPPVVEERYSKRANDIAKMLDELTDPDIKHDAYAAITVMLTTLKKAQSSDARSPAQGPVSPARPKAKK